MNKLFTKIVGAALGLTMAIGVGVAVASSRDAIPVHAETSIGDFDEITSATGLQNGEYLLMGGASDAKVALPVNPTISSGKISGTPIAQVPLNGDGFLWTLTKVGDFWTLFDGTNYVYHSNGGNSGTNLSKGTTASYYWNITSDANGLIFAGVNNLTVKDRGMLLSGTSFGGYALSNKDASGYYRVNLYTPKNAATINAPLTVKAGTEWTVTSVTDNDTSAVLDNVTFEFAAGSGVTIEESDTSAGTFTAKGSGIVTVSATADGYSIEDVEVTVSYADVTSITLSQYSATISKGADFNVGEVIVTVNPSAYAQQTYSWDDYSNTVDDEYLWDETELILTAGDIAGTVTMRVTSGGQYADLVITISGEPIINLDKAVINAYSIDNPVSLTATPENFGDATIVYSWSSSNTSVATIPNNDSATNSVSFVSGSRGSSTITATASVGGVEKAHATCTVNVTKTRNVIETTAPKAVYDFSSLTNTGERSSSDVSGCKVSTDFASDPTISVSKGYGIAAGGLRLATSNSSTGAGYVSFNFGSQSINHIKAYVFGWSATEGEMTVTNYATTLKPNSTTPQLYDFDLSASATTIRFDVAGNKRAILKSVEFSYVSESNIGKTEDVVGLENFIDTYLRSDLPFDPDPENPVNQTTECESLYPNAKKAFNGTSGDFKLNDHQRLLFTTNDAYTNELARLEAWATHVGDSLNESTHVLEANHSIAAISNFASESSAATIIVIISLVGLTAVGGYFLTRRRKEQ